ncbi:MAG: cbb3-type cytochrome oxidase assembly protein CcoS [Planctomycetota bacterium]
MSVLYLLIPLSILIAVIALGAFLWAVHRGQFDDLDGPAYRAMLDDDPPGPRRSGRAVSVDEAKDPDNRGNTI